jgi:broad specificity phosphatase PhoE
MFEQACARWVGGEHDADYKETWPAFRARCVAAIETLVRDLGPSKNAIVFTSGGPVTAICQGLLRIPDEHAFAFNRTLVNGGVTKIIYSERGMYVSTANEHAHYEGEHRELITYR